MCPLFTHISPLFVFKNLSIILSMSSKTFHADENLLEVLCELRPNVLRLSSNELNMTQSIIVQVWSIFISLLHGPIYRNLVKEFWKYASVKFDGTFVSSNVFGNSDTITHATIVAAIGYAQIGTTVELYRFKYYIFKRLNIIHDTTVLVEPTNLSNLLPIAKV